MNKAALVKSVADRAWAAAQWPEPPDEQENDRDQQGGENRPAVKYVDIAHQRRLIGYNVTDITKARACAPAGEPNWVKYCVKLCIADWKVGDDCVRFSTRRD